MGFTGNDPARAFLSVRDEEERMIRAVLFDFDGTIADTIPAIREGVNLTMRAFGYPTHDLAAVRSFVNNGPRKIIERAMPESERDPRQIDRALEVYNDFYGQVYLQTEHAYDGMAELLRDLHGEYRVGVLSNKQDHLLRELCRQVLFPGSYDAVQGVLPEKPSKPDPFLSLRVAGTLGVLPEECAMVGDSHVDIQTARNAGMFHVGVSWGYRDEAFLRESGAVRVAHTPAEVADFLKEERK